MRVKIGPLITTEFATENKVAATRQLDVLILQLHVCEIVK